MLNKIMMSGRLITEPAVTTKDDLRYCKFSIAVDQPKQNGVDAAETDTFLRSRPEFNPRVSSR